MVAWQHELKLAWSMSCNEGAGPHYLLSFLALTLCNSFSLTLLFWHIRSFSRGSSGRTKFIRLGKNSRYPHQQSSWSTSGTVLVRPTRWLRIFFTGFPMLTKAKDYKAKPRIHKIKSKHLFWGSRLRRVVWKRGMKFLPRLHHAYSVTVDKPQITSKFQLSHW